VRTKLVRKETIKAMNINDLLKIEKKWKRKCEINEIKNTERGKSIQILHS
jgi:hypothetical protein